MKDQNYQSHSRIVPGFHFLTLGVVLAAFVISIIVLIQRGVGHETVFNVLISTGSLLLFYYLRQFSTGNQDRIIRAEENERSVRLSGKMLDNRLTKEQIIALRFADDSEFNSLSEKAIHENLSPKAIKTAIKQWRADHHRI
jgi:hypothetical protein